MKTASEGHSQEKSAIGVQFDDDDVPVELELEMDVEMEEDGKVVGVADIAIG